MDKETPLENGLVKFVEEHSETFTDVSSIRRSIIRAFATFQFHQQYGNRIYTGPGSVRPGLKPLALVILNTIVKHHKTFGTYWIILDCVWSLYKHL